MMKNGKRFKKTIVLFTVVSVLTGLWTACQPTPKEEIVIGKGESIINKTEEESMTSYDIDIKKATDTWWKEDFEGYQGSYILKIDAAINVTENNGYSIYSVEPARFNKNELNQFYRIILDEKPIYIYEQTKTQLEQKVIQDKKIKFEQEKLPEEEQTIFFAEGYFEGLQKKYESAINSIEDAKSIDFTYENIVKDKEMLLMVDMGSIMPAKILIQTSEDNKDNRLSYTNYGEDNLAIEYVDNVDNDLSANLPFESAFTIAQKVITDLGVDDMVLNNSALELVIPLNTVDNQDLSDFDAIENKSVYHTFFYTKAPDGVPVNFVVTSVSPSNIDGVTYAKPWGNEYIKIVVGDNGEILEFSWYRPMLISNSIQTSVTLKPFDEIEEVFNSHMLRKYSYIEEQKNCIINMNIDSITLGYAKILSGKNSDSYVLIPVWDFYGNIITEYIGEDIPDKYRFDFQDNFAESILTINAIDGSVIDRSLGY